MRQAAYFIRRRGDECSIVKLHPDGREEILEQGLTLAEAETLYFIRPCEPVHERAAPENGAGDTPVVRRPRQLSLKL